MKVRVALLQVACISLLLAACCPAAVPSTSGRSGAAEGSTAAAAPDATSSLTTLPNTAFVAVLEIDADGSLWARGDDGTRTRLVLPPVSGDPDPTLAFERASMGSNTATAAGRRRSAVRKGELVYVTGSWSGDATVQVASIQVMASARP